MEGEFLELLRLDLDKLTIHSLSKYYGDAEEDH